MTAMTCSRVTPAFTVRMTINPVVVGETACVWATDEWAMEVAPIKVRVSAKTTLRSAFIILFLRSRQALLFSVTNAGVQDVGDRAGSRHRRRSRFASQM